MTTIVDTRTVIEGTQCQGAAESILWSVVPSPAPASVGSVVVRDVTAGNIDVTDSVMPVGNASINGDAITLPALANLVLGHGYRITIGYSDGVNTLEIYFNVICT